MLEYKQHTSGSFGWRFKFVLKVVMFHSPMIWWSKWHCYLERVNSTSGHSVVSKFRCIWIRRLWFLILIRIIGTSAHPARRCLCTCQVPPVWDRKVASHTKSKVLEEIDRNGRKVRTKFQSISGLWLPQVGYMTLRVTFGFFPHNDQLDRENADVQCTMIYHQKFG